MRVEQRHEFLGSYIKQAAAGEFGIAAFQRPFVWTKFDVEKYLESIYDGFPIGDFLIWTLNRDQESSLLSKGRIGPVVHDAATKTMILDGQNRLASIVWAARVGEAPVTPDHPYSAKEREVFLSGETLVADFEEKRMHFVPTEAAYSNTRLPLGELLATSLLQQVRSTVVFQKMEDLGVPEASWNWFMDDIPHLFRAKRTVVAEIQDATAEEAYEVFLRICKTGQPITDADLEAARAWMVPAAEPKP